MTFDPTPEQKRLIDHDGSAFVSACPGAGKTRCIVERARTILSCKQDKRGVAFLSFTNAAISELQERLTKERLLPAPPLPHFVGTFDSFIWSFLVAPFGLKECRQSLKLIPDKENLIVRPFPTAQPLPLKCFDRETGAIIASEASKHRFNRNPNAHQTAASRLYKKLLGRGQLDFDDARRLAIQNLQNAEIADRLAPLLRARFKEIIVDEAQDCNPDDLRIVEWLLSNANLVTKVICDPHQSIYGFRGGVAEELFAFGNTFSEKSRLPLSGNFRSTAQICKSVHALRAPSHRGDVDEALGPCKDLDIDVQVLSYAGRGVSTAIGESYRQIVLANGLAEGDCPLVAKVHRTAMRAVGLLGTEIGQSLSQQLADAAVQFQNALNPQDRLEAVVRGHKIAFALAGKTSDKATYHQVVVDTEIDGIDWRGEIAQKLKALEFNLDAGHTRMEWLSRARNQFGTFLASGDRTIAQFLRNEAVLDEILGQSVGTAIRARTIHSVKGLEFPGICVVLTSATANGILSHIECEPDLSNAESARELYVAASRAEKLLALACPRSQATRLARHLNSFGVDYKIKEI